jgi:hypothetical protein
LNFNKKEFKQHYLLRKTYIFFVEIAIKNNDVLAGSNKEENKHVSQGSTATTGEKKFIKDLKIHGIIF